MDKLSEKNILPLLLAAAASAQAGPPLSTDDTGILEPLQMEIITATTVTSTDAGDYYQAPVLDASLGIVKDHLQISLVYPYEHTHPADGDSESGIGNLEFGMKWRFLRKLRLEMAFAPYYTFGVRPSTARKGIGDSADAAVFPVNLHYKFNDAWWFGSELRYSSIQDGGDEWSYGVSLGHAVNDRCDLLFELVGTSDTGLGNDYVDARIGFDVAMTEDLHILGSVATGFKEPDGENALDYDVFLGVQFLR